MRKFYKKGDEIHELEADGSQDFLLTDEYVPLTDDEVDRHLYPQKYWTAEQVEMARLASFKPLTRRQFMRTLVMNGFDLTAVEAQINTIPDIQQRQLALIDWTSATEFTRTDDTLIAVAQLLGLTSEQIDQMWEFGLTM